MHGEGPNCCTWNLNSSFLRFRHLSVVRTYVSPELDQVITLINGKSVQTPLVNLFHGVIDGDQFNTGKISITLAETISSAKHIAIDPGQIVLSRAALASSMRNHFQGRITNIGEATKGNVRLHINAGETFDVLITHQALQELQLTVSSSVWVNFKSNAVSIF